MKKAILLVNLGAAFLAAGSLVYASVDTHPRATLMSDRDYAAAGKDIERDLATSSIVCKRLTGYEKDVCAAEQAAERKVRFAELEARYLGTYDAKAAARLAHIDGQFDVDRARCEAFAGAERDNCIQIATELRQSLADEARPA